MLLKVLTYGGKEVVVIRSHFLTKTSLAKMNQNVVVDMLCSDNVSAAFFFHTVK